MFFLEGDEFMPNIYLRQHGFTYSVSVPIIKNKEGMQRFEGTVDSRYIYQNEFDKTCFYFDVAYGGSKDLPERTTSDKLSIDEAFNFAKHLHTRTGIKFESQQLEEFYKGII